MLALVVPLVQSSMSKVELFILPTPQIQELLLETPQGLMIMVNLDGTQQVTILSLTVIHMIKILLFNLLLGRLALEPRVLEELYI